MAELPPLHDSQITYQSVSPDWSFALLTWRTPSHLQIGDSLEDEILPIARIVISLKCCEQKREQSLLPARAWSGSIAGFREARQFHLSGPLGEAEFHLKKNLKKITPSFQPSQGWFDDPRLSSTSNAQLTSGLPGIEPSSLPVCSHRLTTGPHQAHSSNLLIPRKHRIGVR